VALRLSHIEHQITRSTMAEDGKRTADDSAALRSVADLARRAGVQWEPSKWETNEIVCGILATHLADRFDRAECEEEDAAAEAGKATGLKVTRILSPAKVLDFIGVDPSKRSEWEDTFGRLWGRDSVLRIISHHLQSVRTAGSRSE
jgi:hypothetical protein